MHVVRDAERRGGGVGPGVLGFDPALLRSIAERVGTPVYVYGANLIRAQYHALHDALQDVPHRICYSVKANGNVGVLKVLKALGAGADIVSVGELRRALAAGFDAASIVFSGVGKTAAELEEAIRVGVGFVNIESSAELDVAMAVARRLKKRASLGIRVNPDVATETHPYTKTGEKTAKFGVPYDEVVSVGQRIAAEPLFTLRGLAMHLGPQITDVEPYHRGTVKLLELVTALRASGLTTIEALDVGGGLGVRYHNEKAPSPQAFADAVAPLLKQAGRAPGVEPRRHRGVRVRDELDLQPAPPAPGSAGGGRPLLRGAAAGDAGRPAARRGARADDVVSSVNRILILDYGSQFTQLIARRVREAHVCCEIHPAARGTDLAFVRQFQPEGIILSGGPSSVFDAGAPTADPALLELGVPVLGICYGMQLVAHLAGGQVKQIGRASCRERV